MYHRHCTDQQTPYLHLTYADSYFFSVNLKYVFGLLNLLSCLFNLYTHCVYGVWASVVYIMYMYIV